MENPITPKSEINRISITIYWGRFLFFKPINLRATLIMINIGMSYYVKEEAYFKRKSMIKPTKEGFICIPKKF